jgi:hypothetical protein
MAAEIVASDRHTECIIRNVSCHLQCTHQARTAGINVLLTGHQRLVTTVTREAAHALGCYSQQHQYQQ